MLLLPEFLEYDIYSLFYDIFDDNLMVIIFIGTSIYGIMNVLSCIINKKERKLRFWYLVTALSIIQLALSFSSGFDDDMILIQLILLEVFILIISLKNIIQVIKSKQNKKKIILYILAIIYGALHFLGIDEYEIIILFFIIDIIISIVMQYLYIRKMNKEESMTRLKLIAYIINLLVTTIIITSLLITFIINEIKFCSILMESNNYKKELKANLDKINIETEGNSSTEEVYIPVCKDNKWGYINEKGEEVISCKYDEVTEFFVIKNTTKTETITYLMSPIDIAFVRNNDEYKIISKDEKIIASCKGKVVPWELENKNMYKGFSEIEEVDSENNVYIKLGTKTENNNDYTEDSLMNNNVEFIFEENEDYTYTIIAQKNDNIISKIENVEYIEDITYSDGSIPFYNFEEQIQGWIDTNGNKYYIRGDYLILDVKDGNILIRDNKTEMVYIYKNGTNIGNVEDIITTKKGYIITYSNKKSYYNEEFIKVTENYDEIDDTYIDKDVLIVNNNEKYSLIDTKGNVLSDQTYDIIKEYEYILNKNYYEENIEKVSEILKDEYEEYKEEQLYINSIDLY